MRQWLYNVGVILSSSHFYCNSNHPWLMEKKIYILPETMVRLATAARFAYSQREKDLEIS